MRTRERIGGAFLLAIGLWLILYGWHVAAMRVWFNVVGAMMGPGAAVVGLALLLVPGYRIERAARGKNLDALEGWALLTPRWRMITLGGLALGLLNWLLMRLGLTPDFFS